MNRRSAIKKTMYTLGGIATVGILSTTITSCKPDTVSSTDNWKPLFLSKDQSTIIADIAERIIPKTKTPGAKDAMVERYIDEMLKNCTSEENRTHFMNGLKSFAENCQKVKSKAFSDCTPTEQDELLKAEEAQAVETRNGADKKAPFFDDMKSMTMHGFFSSEVGAKEVLNYDPIPGEYIPCMPLEDGDVTWAY